VASQPVERVVRGRTGPGSGDPGFEDAAIPVYLYMNSPGSAVVTAFGPDPPAPGQGRSRAWATAGVTAGGAPDA
jgi:hypothetical protein